MENPSQVSNDPDIQEKGPADDSSTAPTDAQLNMGPSEADILASTAINFASSDDPNLIDDKNFESKLHSAIYQEISKKEVQEKLLNDPYYYQNESEEDEDDEINSDMDDEEFDVDVPTDVNHIDQLKKVLMDMNNANKHESSYASDGDDEGENVDTIMLERPQTPKQQPRPAEKKSSTFAKTHFKEDEEKAPFTPL